MSNVTFLSIDVAKNVFQLHGTNQAGKAILKKRVSRKKLAEIVANLAPCEIYMEACSSTNYWGRKFIEHGHKVKLIHPKYVKPYVKRQKNDQNDAAGIAAAARDPDMRFCAVKTEQQQDVQSIHRVRQLLVQQRTALANQIRGLLSEYGISIVQGRSKISGYLADILGSNEYNLSALMLECLQVLYDNFQRLEEQIMVCEQRIDIMFKKTEVCKRLSTIPGIGKLGATILASLLGNGASFKNGRHFAAFLGLVPKQHSSGAKNRLLGISKGGDTYIRTLLIHGARSVLLRVDKKTDKQSMWLKNLIVRRGKNKAAVALANKIARTAWALINQGIDYSPNYKAKVCRSNAAGSLATALLSSALRSPA